MQATIAATVALPELVTVEDVAIDRPLKDVQVIVIPAAPDVDLYEDAVNAWHIFAIDGQGTRFVGRVTQVGVNVHNHKFIAEYLDHADEDLYVSETRLNRKNSIGSAVRWYYSYVALRERQAAYQARREALAAQPGACQIDHCGGIGNNAHVIIRERVYSACYLCREEYGLEVATAA
jgi:hypothetical protein